MGSRKRVVDREKNVHGHGGDHHSSEGDHQSSLGWGPNRILGCTPYSHGPRRFGYGVDRPDAEKYPVGHLDSSHCSLDCSLGGTPNCRAPRNAGCGSHRVHKKNYPVALVGLASVF